MIKFFGYFPIPCNLFRRLALKPAGVRASGRSLTRAEFLTRRHKNNYAKVADFLRKFRMKQCSAMTGLRLRSCWRFSRWYVSGFILFHRFERGNSPTCRSLR